VTSQAKNRAKPTSVTRKYPVKTIRYEWTSENAGHALELVRVEGTNGQPYRFGDGDQTRSVEVPEF